MLDFWNNPLVVSALRIKHRRWVSAGAASMYVLALLGVGMGLYMYQHLLPAPWPRVWFLSIVILQFMVSSLLAMVATFSSLQAEIVNRTLDYQRIVALSPGQILLGKLLGESAGSYLFAAATFPLSVACWQLGAVPLSVMLLLYVQMITTALMFGALGLVHPTLEPPAAKSAWGGRGNSGTGFGLGIFLLCAVPIGMINAGGLLSNRWAAAALGLLTPGLPIYGIAVGDPWHYSLSFFGLEVPYLYITPFTQLLVALGCLRGMVRRLISPLHPTASKGHAYVAVMVVNVLAAGLLFETGGLASALESRIVVFCLIHLAFSLSLVMNATPRREAVLSWIWRLRRPSRIADLLWGERSENCLVAPVLAAIGLAALLLFVVAPAALAGGQSPAAALRMTAGTVVLSSGLVLLALSAAFQWSVLLFGRGGEAWFSILAAVLLFAPNAAGTLLSSDLLRSCGPIDHFAAWFRDPAASLPLAPLWCIYMLVLLVSRLGLSRWIRGQTRVVEGKLRRMGVAQT